MAYEEEHSAIVCRSDIEEVVERKDEEGQRKIVSTIIRCLNEKRDAYSGIVTTIKHLVRSQDVDFILLLQRSLVKSITSCPMQYGGRMFISKAIYRLSAESPEFIAQLFENIINTSSEWSTHFCDQKEVLKLLIVSLKAIRKAEQVQGSKLTSLTEDYIDDLCSKAISQGDDATKLDTLLHLLESRSSTKPIKKKDLIAFQTLFCDALSLQEPAQRQIFVSQTNKLLLRIRDSHRAVMRDRKKYTDESRKNIQEDYMQFLTRLINFCFDSIYCNAYFGSFILTISTLKLVLRNIGLDHNDLKIRAFFTEKRCYDSVISCLSDSFEENKSMALELFFSLPASRTRYSGDNLRVLEDIAYKLVESVNPAHALTCLYVFKLIIGLQIPEGDNGIIKNQILYQHLCKLMDKVDHGVEDTKQNFVKALKRNAIYPKLTCIKALLDEINPEHLETDRDKWTQLSTRIVVSSIASCQAVSNVVCNLNPETIGHLPMDLKPVDIVTLAKALDVSTQISNDQIETVSSQMLLISGWKTIKECSLSMAAMCSNLWWPKEKDEKELRPEPILAAANIERIIGFFDHYLRNLRHRGAFEQAYNGFSVVAREIWREEALRSRLFSLLKQVMDDFKEEESETIDDKKKECLKAYVTRRSAGLPFIIQAILSAEDRHDSRTLRYVMKNLFEVLERPTAEVYQKIHCLNILRAIIKDYHLGEKVLSYVGKTLDITLDSFSSESFSIRNCASMLLKSTIDRIFGVNRLRENIHRRNQLSYEKFFSLCPTIRSKMLNILATGVIDRNNLASVHAVFIILFRLRPRLSAEPDSNSGDMIKSFIDPLIQITLDCPDLRIRGISARLVVQLQADYETVTSAVRFSGRDQVVDELKDIVYHVSPNHERNRLHGALQLTKEWLEEVKLYSCEDISNHHLGYLDFARRVVRELLLFVRPDVNSTIKSVALDIAELCNVIVPNQSSYFLDMFPRYKVLVKKREGFAEPNFECMLFKFTCNLLMAALHASTRPETQDVARKLLADIVSCISELVVQPSSITISTNLQASLIRLLRQLSNPTNPQIDRLMNSLDMDQTFVYTTPIDKLKYITVDDLGRHRWSVYCESPTLSRLIRENVANFSKIFDFRNFDEFILSKDSQVFKSKYSNTLRSIELLALTVECWDTFELEHNAIWTKVGESTTDKVKYLTKFVRDLPDCDIKCLLIICIAKLVKVQLSSMVKAGASSDDLESVNEFGKLLEDMCDSDHSYLIRETCSRALQIYIHEIKLINNSTNLRIFLISTLSTIIKLTQDEEHQIRVFCKNALIDALASNDPYRQRGQLEALLSYITTVVFDPSNERDVCDCFTLMLRIVFDHSRNYSAELQEKDERLFDKTKLNTFADHIRTIQSCFASLQAFLTRNPSHKIDLDKLHLTSNVIFELSLIDKPINESSGGDYSWRKEKGNAQSEYEISCLPVANVSVSNNQVITQVMNNLISSLEYFQEGYYNVLIDTEYNSHELSLFRRISFLVFIFKYTENKLECDNFKKVLNERLREIATKKCATTLICKCIEALSSG